MSPNLALDQLTRAVSREEPALEEDGLHGLSVSPATETKTHVLQDGARVTVSASSCEIADARGRLLIRYRSDGALEVAGASGDVVLSAPNGKVVVESGKGVEVAAPSVTARVETASLTARAITTTAVELTQTVERLELRATRILERARDVFRDASGLVQQRAGSLRALVEGTYTVNSRETTMLSEKETSIDGSRIHLG